jgi:hypothetical protein
MDLKTVQKMTQLTNSGATKGSCNMPVPARKGAPVGFKQFCTSVCDLLIYAFPRPLFRHSLLMETSQTRSNPQSAQDSDFHTMAHEKINSDNVASATGEAILAVTGPIQPVPTPVGACLP